MGNNKRIAIIGLGPHAKRVYLHFLRVIGNDPVLIIDLESNYTEIIEYIKKENIKAKIVTIPDSERDNMVFSSDTREKVVRELLKNKITHVIISTEPLSHYVYCNICLDLELHILLDKPVALPNVSTSLKMAAEIVEIQKKLVEQYKLKSNNKKFIIQAQRRWHRGYKHIMDIIANVIKKFGVPITNVEIYHCDGKWHMPNEYHKMINHPYKHGYGKLMHSGYHFVDLLMELIKLNNLSRNHDYDKVSVYSNVTRPEDVMLQIDQDARSRFFSSRICEDRLQQDHSKFGEIDVSSSIKFSKKGKVITLANLNLLQTGFTRRSWTNLPEDAYKSNGRVRHERINVQVGTIMNVQIHSYQAYEIKDRKKTSNKDVGDVEHFDIYIFRNSDLIGGIPYEKVEISKLSKDEDNVGFIGYNEQARKAALIEFLDDNPETRSHLVSHNDSIMLLSAIYYSISKGYLGEYPVHEYLKRDLDCFEINNVKKKDFRVAVEIIVKSERGIFLCRRSNHVNIAPGDWSVPAGKVKFDELPTAAAIRELEEETGIKSDKIKNFKEIAVRTLSNIIEDTEYFRLVYTFSVEISINDCNIVLNDEHDKGIWVTPCQVNNSMFDTLSLELRELIKKI